MDLWTGFEDAFIFTFETLVTAFRLTVTRTISV
jgi:hypothetical protein